MTNLRLKITYLEEILDILQRRCVKLKNLQEIGNGDRDIGKRLADGMLKSAREHYYEIRRGIKDADKDSKDAKLLSRRMTSIEGYCKKIYKLCGYEHEHRY